MSFKGIVRCSHTKQGTQEQADVNTEISTTEENPTAPVLTNKVCLAVAVAGTPYCRHHLPLHKEDYEKFLADKKNFAGIKSETKYKFLRPSLMEGYREKLASGNKLYDLRQDIALLTALLEEIVNNPRVTKTETLIRIIDQQRKCLATMNDIRRTTMMMFSQEKMNTLLDRVIQVINKHIQSSDLKKAIAVDFVEVSKEFEDEAEK